MELGKPSHYDSEYNPARLYAIPRAANRKDLGLANALPFFGYDLWNHYEVSWLNTRGKPQVATAEIMYSCTSEYIVESKSLKLYFNSLNNSRYGSIDELETVVAGDLSRCVQAPVTVSIRPLVHGTHLALSSLNAICIDGADIEVDEFKIDPTLLKANGGAVSETLCSDLLKSNCLVTGQPDWGSVWISYTGPKICRTSLLHYIVSFRTHNEFHEHCVERIFMDITRHCAPTELTVGARYTRRGGIDINPVRSSQVPTVVNLRLIRQ